MELLWFGSDETPREWTVARREAVREWMRPRPVLGGSLLVVGGIVIGYVPLQFAPQLLLVGGTQTIIGLLFATFVAFCGVSAVTRPELSSVFGVLGGAFATLSLMGALGGLFVGTIVGTVGGILCYAWEPPTDVRYEEATLADASEFIWAGTGEFIWQTDAANDEGAETPTDATDPVADGSEGERIR